MIEANYFSQPVCKYTTSLKNSICYIFCQCYSRIVKKNFLQLVETTGEILQTTIHSYLKILHRKNVWLVSNES